MSDTKTALVVEDVAAACVNTLLVSGDATHHVLVQHAPTDPEGNPYATKAQLADEATARADGDAANATALAAEITERQAAIDTERQERIAGDVANAQLVAAEAQLRTQADAALGIAIGQDLDAMAQTVAAALQTEKNNRIDADVAEKTARENGDNQLQAQIDALSGVGFATQAYVDTAVQGEATTRSDADTALRQDLSAETTERIAGDAATADAAAAALAAAVTTLNAADTATAATAAAALASAVTALDAADADLQSQINALGGGLADYATQAQLAAEVLDRTAGDTTLNDRITTVRGELITRVDDQVANGMANALTTARADIATEKAERVAADDALNTAKVDKAAVGVSIAQLDGTGKVPAAQLPSFVDDVMEYATQAAFPATGEAGKMYVALNNNKVYRWGGTAYVEINPSPGSTDAVPEGAVNKYFTDARAKAAVAGDIAAAVTTEKNERIVADTTERNERIAADIAVNDRVTTLGGNMVTNYATKQSVTDEATARAAADAKKVDMDISSYADLGLTRDSFMYATNAVAGVQMPSRVRGDTLMAFINAEQSLMRAAKVNADLASYPHRGFEETSRFYVQDTAVDANGDGVGDPGYATAFDFATYMYNRANVWAGFNQFTKPINAPAGLTPSSTYSLARSITMTANTNYGYPDIAIPIDGGGSGTFLLEFVFQLSGQYYHRAVGSTILSLAWWKAGGTVAKRDVVMEEHNGNDFKLTFTMRAGGAGTRSLTINPSRNVLFSAGGFLRIRAVPLLGAN